MIDAKIFGSVAGCRHITHAIVSLTDYVRNRLVQLPIGLSDGTFVWLGDLRKCVCRWRNSPMYIRFSHAVFAWNLRFLDRERDIIYPWRREDRFVRESDHGDG